MVGKADRCAVGVSVSHNPHPTTHNLAQDLEFLRSLQVVILAQATGCGRADHLRQLFLRRFAHSLQAAELAQ